MASCGRTSRTTRFQGRPGTGEVLLQHPLAEGLGQHRPGILHAEGGADAAAVVVRGPRHDPVDHAVRKAQGGLDPACRAGTDRRVVLEKQPAQRMAVAGQVVARGDGDAGQPAIAAPQRGRVQQAHGAARAVRVAAVVLEVGMVGLQAVALFGDRQRDPARVRSGDSLHHALRLLGCHQQLAQRADDAQPRLRAVELRHRVVAVLRGKRIPGDRAAQADAADAPARRATGHGLVQVDRLVCAEEVADAEMHDTDGGGSCGIGRACDIGRQAREGGGAQPWGGCHCFSIRSTNGRRRCSIARSTPPTICA